MCISPSILEEVDRVLGYPKISRVLKRAGKSKFEVPRHILSMSILVRPHENTRILSPIKFLREYLRETKQKF